MQEINTEITQYNLEGYTDYDGNHFEVMEPAENGHWVRFYDYETTTMALKDRIVFLENICDEQTRILTGD